MSVLQAPTSLSAIGNSFLRNRGLIWQMTQRQVVGRYRGSIIGMAWSFLHPLLMLTVYTFVFSGIFNAHWNVDGDKGRTSFALVLFAGMIVHALFAECINRAPTLILENVGYVKKVRFPLEILPMVALGSALFHAAISIAILLLALALIAGEFHGTVLLLPVVLLPLLALILGIAWLLASLGTYLRDVAQAVGVFTTIMMFCSPVFYPASAVPQPYQWLLDLNPLAFFIEQTRNVVLWGTPPDWTATLIWATIGLITAWTGFWWFQKTRKGFADVL